MSLPPQLIRVKRKATEDSPVAFLRVQENKRHRSEDFVYQLKGNEAKFASIPISDQRPVIHTSLPPRDDPASQKPPGAENAASKDGHGCSPLSPTVGPSESIKIVGTAAPEPRRFHMSLKDTRLAPLIYPTHRRNGGGISKKRGSAPALFVERNIRRKASKHFAGVAHGVDTKAGAVSPPSDISLPPTSTPVTLPDKMEVDITETRKLKKPGLAKRAKKDDAPARKPQLPASMINRWGVDLDQLTADMNAFAMEQIGMNLQQAEDQKARHDIKVEPQTPASPRSPQMKFKPRAPIQRYAERHPESEPTPEPTGRLPMDDPRDLSDDDEDYIIETYVRVPASTMDKQHVPPQDVGLLVFDAEPDMEFFYGGDSDSEDEWAEDEEDENAENYYTADYPDEEVASDDEFGYNAYAYRNGNASDLEEYDVHDSNGSPSEGSVNPVGGFRTFVGRDGQIRKHL